MEADRQHVDASIYLVVVCSVYSNVAVGHGWTETDRVVTDRTFRRWDAAVFATRVACGLGCCVWTPECFPVGWALMLKWALVWAWLDWVFMTQQMD